MTVDARLSGARHGRSGRSNVWLTLGIAIVATLVLLGVILARMVLASQANQEANHRNAQRISDQGIQEASLRLAAEPSWRAGFPKTQYLDGWYTVSVTEIDTGGLSRISLSSEGHCHASVIRQIYVLRLNRGQNGEILWERESVRQE